MERLSSHSHGGAVAALSAAEREYAVNLLETVVKIYSPSGSESELGRFLEAEMTRLGLETEVDEVGNVLGRMGGGRPRLLLSGHMDTVPGVLPVRASQGRILGRGAVDAKAALAAMIVAAGSHKDRIRQGELTVACLVDEEGQSRGVRNLVSKAARADWAIFGEPSGVDNLTVGYKGSLHITIACGTASGHASSPWAFENAIERGYELCQRIRQEIASPEPVEDRFGSVSTCLTGIRGGNAINVVPGECTATIDIRVPPRLKTTEVSSSLERLVDRFRAEHSTVDAHLRVDEASEGYEIAEDQELVQVLRDGIERVRGKIPRLLRKTGTGDMNLYGAALGVPSVTYGPGNSRLSHGPAESVQVSEYLDSITVLRLAVVRLLSARQTRSQAYDAGSFSILKEGTLGP